MADSLTNTNHPSTLTTTAPLFPPIRSPATSRRVTRARQRRSSGGGRSRATEHGVRAGMVMSMGHRQFSLERSGLILFLGKSFAVKNDQTSPPPQSEWGHWTIEQHQGEQLAKRVTMARSKFTGEVASEARGAVHWPGKSAGVDVAQTTEPPHHGATDRKPVVIDATPLAGPRHYLGRRGNPVQPQAQGDLML